MDDTVTFVSQCSLFCNAKLLLTHTIVTNIEWKRENIMYEKTIKMLNRESKHSMYKSTSTLKNFMFFLRSCLFTERVMKIIYSTFQS